MNGVEVFWESQPEHQSERDFLNRLRSDLVHQQIDGLILANFYLGSGLQIDFLVVTPERLWHIELKHYAQPIVGGKNGPWKTRQADGSLQEIHSQNPYAQAASQRFSLSDELGKFAEKVAGTPQPPGKKFYYWFDTVTCVFPALAADSSVPSDHKVKTLGYNDLLALLTSSAGPRFPWDQQRWRKFIQYLGLTPANTATTPVLTNSDVRSAIENYRQVFVDFYSRGLHELVPTPLVPDNPGLANPDVLSLLRGGTSIQLIGQSGSGKSHLATHTALSGLSGWVPIFVRAGLYDQRLSNLLDRSVAPLTALTAKQVFNAAAQLQSPILLVLDGFNECSAELQGQLVSDLTALWLRQKFILLLTNQVLVSLPPQIDTEIIHMGMLGTSDKEAVLASYRALEIAGISEPFQTSYELSLAAECAAELKAPVTRAQLFDAFVRRSLASSSSPAATRAALRKVALAMDEKLTAALPVDEVWRCAERAVAQQAVSFASVDDMFRCKLVRMQQGWLAFSHELVGRFLAGEALLLSNQPTQLARELERPRHADLPELVLPLETRAANLRLVLTHLADVKLYLKSLDGELGSLGSDIANGQAHAALAASVTLMDNVSLIFQHLDSLPQADLDRDGLSGAECAILSAVAKQLPAGYFLDEALQVFDATDRALHRAAHAYNQEKNKVLSPTALAATIVGIRPEHRRQLPAAILIEGCEHARYDYQLRRRSYEPINAAILEPLLRGVGPKEYSRLYFLCLLLLSADHLSVVHLVPAMLRKCWESRAYHLRLQGLQTTQFFCREATGEVRDEIVALLDSFDVRDNIMLSSMLVEVLSSYGLIDPPGTAEGVLNEIRGLLSTPSSDEVHRTAYGVYGSQFEDVIAEPYCEAIAALSDDERIRFFTLAAQGADGGFFADTILHELLPMRDARTLSAFEYWSRCPGRQSSTPQESVTCYSLAVQGLAYLKGSLPQQRAPADEDEAAWYCYGQLIFWLHHPGIDHKQTLNYCKPVWDRLLGPLALAAVDPLYWLLHAWSLRSPEHSKGEDTDSHGLIVRTFPDEVRHLLERALRQLDRLSSLYRHWDDWQLARYVLSTLGSVGEEQTISLLEDYVESPHLGREALQSIKMLHAKVDNVGH